MVEYIIKAPPLERLGDAVAEALAEGVTQQELMGVVLTTVATYTPPMADEAECEDFRGPDTVYTELPPGLIDLPTAAQKYDLNRGTLRNWVTKGYLKRYGRLKGSAQGGGFILVSESELRLYMDMPKNKGGRPSKT